MTDTDSGFFGCQRCRWSLDRVIVNWGVKCLWVVKNCIFEQSILLLLWFHAAVNLCASATLVHLTAVHWQDDMQCYQQCSVIKSCVYNVSFTYHIALIELSLTGSVLNLCRRAGVDGTMPLPSGVKRWMKKRTWLAGPGLFFPSVFSNCCLSDRQEGHLAC